MSWLNLVVDKMGWPVERIKGRPFTNILLLLIHGSIWRTVKHILHSAPANCPKCNRKPARGKDST